MNIDQAFPTKYLAAHDLSGRDVTVQIASVNIEEVGQGDTKPVVYFQGANKGLVLNKTNAHRIADMYGVETDNWRGKSITLYPSETDFQGKTVPCIRIRLQTLTATEVSAPVSQAPTQQSVEAQAKTGGFDDEIPF